MNTDDLALSAPGYLSFAKSWAVGPGCYISRLWRLKQDWFWNVLLLCRTQGSRAAKAAGALWSRGELKWGENSGLRGKASD